MMEPPHPGPYGGCPLGGLGGGCIGKGVIIIRLQIIINITLRLSWRLSSVVTTPRQIQSRDCPWEPICCPRESGGGDPLKSIICV